MLIHDERLYLDPFQTELVGCYALKAQWNQCIKYAEELRVRSQHSPACATYTLAIFKYVLSEETDDQELKREVSALLEYMIKQIIIIILNEFYVELYPRSESDTLGRLLPRRRWPSLTQRSISETMSSWFYRKWSVISLCLWFCANIALMTGIPLSMQSIVVH